MLDFTTESLFLSTLTNDFVQPTFPIMSCLMPGTPAKGEMVLFRYVRSVSWFVHSFTASGTPTRARTWNNPLIWRLLSGRNINPLLYQLSYWGIQIWNTQVWISHPFFSSSFANRLSVFLLVDYACWRKHFNTKERFISLPLLRRNEFKLTCVSLFFAYCTKYAKWWCTRSDSNRRPFG